MNRRLFRQNSRRATLAVEAAIIMPLVIFITLAVLEYGWMFMKIQQVTNAARQAARVGVRADGTEADIQATVDTLMSAANMPSTWYVVETQPSDVSTLLVSDPLTVTLIVPYGGNADYPANLELRLIGAPFLPVPGVLRASVTMIKEGV